MLPVPQEDMVDVRKQLLNQLMLLDAPSFIYAAQPSPAAAGGRRRHAGAALLKAADASGLEDEDSVTVFGTYAAVTLCDCRRVGTASVTLHSGFRLHPPACCSMPFARPS
jgi:hypothetical protein